MENPHEQVQNALLSRIINNMEDLNESIVTMNKSLQELNRENMNSELLSQMWENYSKNSQFNLETTGQVQPPM
ncbi:DASH complex subunit DAD4 [[Candida] zeylanoides]